MYLGEGAVRNFVHRKYSHRFAVPEFKSLIDGLIIDLVRFDEVGGKVLKQMDENRK